MRPEDIQVDIPRALSLGALPTNRGLTLSVQVQQEPVGTTDQLVALFKSPAFAEQMSPLRPDEQRPMLSTTVALGPIAASVGNPPKAAPVHIIIARQRGAHLEELARRTLFVTVAVPGYADMGSRPAPIDLPVRSFEVADDEDSSPEGLPDGPLLPDQMVEETDLSGSGNSVGARGYWRMVSSLIHQRIGRLSHTERKGFHGDMPVISFRLYTNGEAQLITVERSSGNADMDRTAVLAVVDAHPFPRFPRVWLTRIWMYMSRWRFPLPDGARFARHRVQRFVLIVLGGLEPV
jgi:TonB family protein